MQLRLLGPMAVIADGKPLPLPASRKTRALLGYLAAEGKPVRRERLCHLFWEIPDDPKGALRWSLSKLRGLLGDAIVADRETAALDLTGLDVDFIQLKAAAANLAATPTERLEQICASASGGLFMLSPAHPERFGMVLEQPPDHRFFFLLFKHIWWPRQDSNLRPLV